MAARPHGELAVRRGQPGLERLVHEQPPDLFEGNVADELLDFDAAIAKGATLPVRLGDLRLEGDDALEARSEVVAQAHSDSSSSISRPIARSRAAVSTSAAAAASCTATPTDLYRVI